MKTASRVTLALILASASPVFAQDGAPSDQPQQPPPVATVAQYPAPMTDSWSNVSHINGTAVPVGDKNNFLKEFKRTNISSNPIGWITGVYGLSASYAVSDNLVLKGDANIFNDFFGGDGYEVNATALLYLRRAYSGPYLEAGVMQREIHDRTDCSDCGSMSTTQTGPEGLVGYTSMFDSGFNISYAIGFARDMNATNYDGQPSSSTEDQLTPTGYLRVGYAF